MHTSDAKEKSVSVADVDSLQAIEPETARLLHL